MTDTARPSTIVGDDGGAPDPRAMVFVRDKASEDIVRQSLMSLGVADARFRPGGVEAATAEVSKQGVLKLLIVDADGAFTLASISALVEACPPSTGIILLGESNDLSLYRHLRDEGVADYIFKPLVSALVTKACERILTGSHEREGAPSGRAITFLGVRGGVGATTLAVRTAWALAAPPPRPVIMVDLQLRFGDAALQLDVAPNDALEEALSSADRVDELFVERGVIHVADRLDLMASLASVNKQPQFSEDAFLLLIQRLQRRYRYVVLDVPAYTTGLMPRALEAAATFVLVSDGRLASAREIRRWRDVLEPDLPGRDVLHILNRHGSPGDLAMDDFVRAAGQAPDIIIPYARDIGVATNLGIRARPDCADLQRGLAPLLERIAGRAPPQGRPLLKRLFG